MGEDKALLKVGGKLLLEALVDQLAPWCDSVMVAVGDADREERYRLELGAAAEQVEFVHDQYPRCGPLSGMHAGLRHMSEGYAFVIACDMPVISMPLVSRLQQHIPDGAAIIYANKEPMHAFYHSRAAEQVEASLLAGEYRLMNLLAKLDSLEVEWTDIEEEGASPFLNLNTPEDYARYRRKAAPVTESEGTL